MRLSRTVTQSLLSCNRSGRKLHDERLNVAILVRGEMQWKGLIESMMGLRPRQGNLRLVFRLLSLMRGLPSIRLK